jgi:sirohydrochlorin ferrochelatase
MLIVVAHGERGGARTNHALADSAARLSSLLPYADVRHCVLNGEPSVSSILPDRDDHREVHVFPFFMSEGYFTRSAIPTAFADAGPIVLHRPLGVIPGIVDLIERVGTDAAVRLAPRPEDVTLLLAAHGSSGSADARQAIERHREALSLLSTFAEVRAAYLEEPPMLKGALASLVGPTVVVGLFAGEGLHGGEDMPNMLNALPHRRCIYTGSIAANPAVPHLIAREVFGRQRYTANAREFA